jgi:hypothetical protein
MTAAVAFRDLGSFRKPTGSYGVSQDFNVVAGMYQSAVEHILESSTEVERLRNSVVALRELHERCGQQNWDGNRAEPIGDQAFRNAKEFLWALPSVVPVPEIIAEPNGDVGFEWYINPRQVFVASVSGARTLTYAGLFGPNKTSGEEQFVESVPTAIMQNIRRLLGRG